MKIIFLAFKDLKILLSNKRELSLHIFFPVIVVLLVISLFGGKPALYGEAFFIDQDGGLPARNFINRIEEVRGLKVFIIDEEQAARKLERSDILMVTEIPSDFSEKITEGQSPQLNVWQRGSGGDTGQMLLSLNRSVIAEMMGEVQMTFLVKDFAEDSPHFQEEKELEAFMDSFFRASLWNPGTIITERVIDDQKEMAVFFLPGIITLFLIFSITFSAQIFVEEKNQKILERLSSSGLSKGEILGGKVLGNVFKGTFQLLILLVITWLLLSPFTPLTFFKTLIFSLLVITSISLISVFIGCISRKPEQALWASVIISLVNSAMGNTFAFPREEGTIIEIINFFTVSFYANRGLRSLIIQGGSLSGLVMEMLALAFIALIFLVICLYIFSSADS